MNHAHPSLVALIALFVVRPLPAIEPAAERILAEEPNGESYGRHLLYLTEEPHMAGRERNLAHAEYVGDRFR